MLTLKQTLFLSFEHDRRKAETGENTFANPRLFPAAPFSSTHTSQQQQPEENAIVSCYSSNQNTLQLHQHFVMAAPSQLSPNQASETAAAAAKKNDTTEDAAVTAVAPSNTTAEEESKDTTLPTVTLKDPPNATLKDPPPPQQVELTYASTQTSNVYLLAKHLLQEGDFDQCLSTIEEEMTRITSLLANEDASVHESMAPLYYLYGTTLLYSIEESTDVANTGMTAGSNEEEEEEEMEDSQIAWENLETARHIVQGMVNTTTTPLQKVQLDLAQIHLRLGDLLKSNGRYVEAIQDYQQCLEIRQPLLGMYHRKVASMYHALGLVYMLLASEGDKEESDFFLTPQQVEEYRRQSIEAYVACAKSFAGQIAFLCGASPEQVTADEENVTNGGGKTTGMDDAELAFHSSSNTIRAIRERVKNLSTTGDDQENVHEYKELLDEIQETIDEVQNAKEGIKEVSHMKVKAKEAVAASDGGVVENADGSTTTIGFGSAAAMSEAATIAPVASATAAKPMMVVKKKKKRDAKGEANMSAQGDAKRAKTE